MPALKGMSPRPNRKIATGTTGGRATTRPSAVAHISDQPVTVAASAQCRGGGQPRARKTRLEDRAICVVDLAFCLNISVQRIQIGDDIAGLFFVDAHRWHGVARDY